MELSFLSIVGYLLIVGGLLLPIYTANLFPLSKKSNDQYQEMMRKGDRGWIIDFKINQWIRKNWIYIPVLGVLLFFIGLLF